MFINPKIFLQRLFMCLLNFLKAFASVSNVKGSLCIMACYNVLIKILYTVR